MRRIVLSATLLALAPLTAAACGMSGPCGERSVEVVGGFASSDAERKADVPPINGSSSGTFGAQRPPKVIYSGCSPYASSCSYGGDPRADFVVHSDGSVERY